MSGGHYDYAHYKVESFARDILREEKSPLRLAFAKHLEKVAKAMHDVEWYDSGDAGSSEQAEASMKEVLGEHWKELSIEEGIKQCAEIIQQIKEL